MNKTLLNLIDIIGVPAFIIGLILPAIKWVYDININNVVTLCTGIAGLIYMCYKIYETHINIRIKKKKLNQDVE